MKDTLSQSARAEEIFQASRNASEPEGIARLRANAFTQYEFLPTPKFERSNLANRSLDAFRLEAPLAPGAWEALADGMIGEDDAHPLIVLVDGHVMKTRGLTADGVIVTDMKSALVKHPELVEKHIGKVVASNENQLIALNTALFRNGAFVYLPRNAALTQPIQLIAVTTQGGYGSFTRNLIIAEEMSQVTFLDAYLTPADLAEDLHVGVTEVVAMQGAVVRVGTIEEFSKDTTGIVLRRANVERNANVQWVLGEIGDGYSVVEFGSRLLGDGSSSTSHAIALGSGRSHMDITSKMVHIGKFSESDTTARGVMQDQANAVYRGVTQIKKGASGANGQQAEKLLMLSPESRADAIPMLLIDENDVKCGHAASVGQINEDQLFYLMSRGLSEATAKRMIVWGFIDPVLAELPLDGVRRAVEMILERKLA
ncbi:Fe-S cluster assembly protein SufD [Ferroacidibacillus organovorans]|uniref:Fe-S cluster assembly protein SufD n=1 Tax=Ferroacidibacillus organovorans TaxID=1765683 RepID=A0A101XP38_9BACL|nr:Fe-S cluster assembly protein SufD [Ferroacidibacillus organovorans]KUO94988.1 hypothetical protein ATW55_04965 [Ferroacidibacillus organovorans]